jgi:hypothetical protein
MSLRISSEKRDSSFVEGGRPATDGEEGYVLSKCLCLNAH